MHNRPTQEELAALHKEYKKDRLYQNLYAAMSSVIGKSHSITPMEIWELALQYAKDIVHGENGIFEIDALPNNLCFILAEYKNPGETASYRRSKEDVIHICFLVELVMLYQLTRYQKDWNRHPYLKYCKGLISHIQDDPLFPKVQQLITEANDRYEINYSCELEPEDYVPSLIKDDSIIKEAIQLSVDCKDYLASGYDIQWLKQFWTELISSNLREEVIRDLQSPSKYVTIYQVIGMLHREGVFHGNPTILGKTHFSNDTRPTSDTIRKYVSKGMDFTVTPIAKFVNRYVSEHKAKQNSQS